MTTTVHTSCESFREKDDFYDQQRIVAEIKVDNVVVWTKKIETYCSGTDIETISEIQASLGREAMEQAVAHHRYIAETDAEGFGMNVSSV